MILFWAEAALASALFILIVQLLGAAKLKRLDQISLRKLHIDASELPLVSVVVPACNEAENIKATVTDLIEQEYPRLEIIVINDRSTDSTGVVIDELNAMYPLVRSVHIENLPDGWLGKNHALHVGAQIAEGDFILFTDGDVRFEKVTLSRAVQYALEHRLDHLTLSFQNSAPGGLLNAVIVEAMTGLLMVFQPWKVRNQKDKYFIGIGAFNMVRKDAYHEVGGHAANKMHPIDDIILGKAIHDAGLRQDCLRGDALVRVDWYENTRDMINGLMKNVFCFYNYNVIFAGLAASFIILFSILPYLGVLLTTGITQLFCCITVLIKGIVFIMNARVMRKPAVYVLFQPLAVCILLYISLKATVTTLRNGGITWRGTFYPLDKLRQAKPIITLKWLLLPKGE